MDEKTIVLHEEAFQAAIRVGSNMAGEYLVRDILTEYLTVAGMTAPAEMPSDEQIEAEILPMSYEVADLTECVARVKALFAPIVAKERLARCWEKECEERTSIGKMALDRALAAEAALAKAEEELEDVKNYFIEAGEQ